MPGYPVTTTIREFGITDPAAKAAIGWMGFNYFQVIMDRVTPPHPVDYKAIVELGPHCQDVIGRLLRLYDEDQAHFTGIYW